MTFSYTTSSPTVRDKVRLLIGDTNASLYVFEDGELDMLLALDANDPTLAAARALRIIAADEAKLVTRFSVNGTTVDRAGKVKDLLASAEALEKMATTAPFELESVLEYATDSSGKDLTSYPDSPADEDA